MVQKYTQSQAMLSDKQGFQTPVASMVEAIVGCKWAVGLLGLLDEGVRRPSDMLRALPDLSTKVMNERLQKMLRFGIIERTVFGDKPPLRVEYALTPFGHQFMGIIAEVRQLQETLESGALTNSETCDNAIGTNWPTV